MRLKQLAKELNQKDGQVNISAIVVLILWYIMRIQFEELIDVVSVGRFTRRMIAIN